MRRFIVWMSVVVGISLFLTCAGLALPIELVAYTLFGWIFYLARTLPDVKLTSDGAATAGICLVLLAVGLHFFLAWLYREIRNPARVTMPRVDRWKWRWTADALVVTVLMFVAGMAVTGMAHQIGWLLNSKEPWVEYGGGARDAARRAQSVNNLKQIGLALHVYHDNHHSFPPGGTFDSQGRPLQSWQAMILPYTEQTDLYRRIDFSVAWNDQRNAPAFQTEIDVYLRPGVTPKKNAAGYALSQYAANVYMLGGDRPRTLSEVSDGTGSTLMAGEVHRTVSSRGATPQIGETRRSV